MLERTSFPFAKGYLASQITVQSDWSFVLGLIWVLYTWNSGEGHSIEANEHGR